MDKIKITMFNKFTITYNNQTIIVNNIVTKKMCGLLQMIVYHKNGVSKEDLIDELWQDVADPINSLKYSIFRLRVMLASIDCFKGINLISTIKNGYVFAPDYIVETDYNAMNHYHSIMLDKKTSDVDCSQCALNILALYVGVFFVNDVASWSTHERVYYSSIYEQAFSLICDDYIKNNREDELIPIIINAIKVDQFYDGAYEYYMRVLITCNEYAKATQLYHHINELYERELGQLPSKHIRTLYKSITNVCEDVVDAKELKNALLPTLKKPSALYCDYDTFRYIYRVSLINARRTNTNIFLLVIELISKEDMKQLENYMKKLKIVLCDCLRAGDVLTKINQTQMIVLLPCKTLDNGYIIIQRVTYTFYKIVNEERCRIHYHISSIDDMSGELGDN